MTENMHSEVVDVQAPSQGLVERKFRPKLPLYREDESADGQEVFYIDRRDVERIDGCEDRLQALTYLRSLGFDEVVYEEQRDRFALKRIQS